MLFGAVGGPKWDTVPYAVRPEAGLLRLRKELDLFANLRPAICYPALADASSLKRELVEGLDIMIVRELTGGVYFGEPKEIVTLENGEKRAVDTQVYTTHEIERIARVAFDLARKRRNKVHSAEKRNVMKTGVLWQRGRHRACTRPSIADVELEHMLADNCAMQLVRNPKQFDVIVTDNLFGDMLSDDAAMLTGSLGMLPSASLGARRSDDRPAQGAVRAGARLRARHRRQGPRQSDRDDRARFGMALRYSFGLVEEADRLDKAIANVLASGMRTKDIAAPGANAVGTQEVGDAIVKELEARRNDKSRRTAPGAIFTCDYRIDPSLRSGSAGTGCARRRKARRCGSGRAGCAEAFAVVPGRHDQ